MGFRDWVIKINGKQMKIEEAALGISILVLVIITIGNVISRKVFNFSWYFAEEVSQFAMLITIFVGLSYGTAIARHIRMTALFDAASNKIKRVLIMTSSLVTSLVLFFLMYHSVIFVNYLRFSRRVTPALGVPYYLTLIWVPIGLFAGGVQYMFTFIRNVIDKDEVWLAFNVKSGTEGDS